MYICENCGKEHDGTFGSGRFCSRSCANSHKMTDERRSNISKGLKKETKCNCRYCDKEFNNLTSRASHERLCANNPDKLSNAGGKANHNKKLICKVKLRNTYLNITYGELEKYREDHPVCEICGRSIEDIYVNNPNPCIKNLSIDHDHNTGKFRGLLCQLCNRQLGWYENNKEAINVYLNK